MGFWDSLKNLTKPYDDDDEYYDGESPPIAEQEPPRPTPVSAGRGAFAGSYGESARRGSPPIRESKVVNISSAPQLRVVLVKPERFETAAEIADNLRDRCTVVMNLEHTGKDVARRLIDFLSGVAYAQDGKIKKVAVNTYLITPYTVDLLGDLIDELENNGLYF